jgi:hypothetical protein
MGCGMGVQDLRGTQGWYARRGAAGQPRLRGAAVQDFLASGAASAVGAEGISDRTAFNFRYNYAAIVSHSCACIGSPCLRHCVHGASIGASDVRHRAASACLLQLRG